MESSRISRRMLFVGAAAAAAATACGGGCPEPNLPEQAYDEWEAELDRRHLLSLSPKADLSIKRDVHNLEVSSDAGALAKAFHDVMRDPNRRFGLIRVNRKRANVGKPFTLGERFQGRYSIEDAVKEQLEGKWKRIFGKLVDHESVRRFLCAIENQSTSDYGEITKLDLDPPPGKLHVLRYSYLSGSPIAGSSTFIVADVASDRCRLTQIFEYQEQDASFATFFSAGGLKLHNQVVFSQASQAVGLIGARILATDIPEEYQEL